MTSQPLQRVKFKVGHRPAGWHDKEYNVMEIQGDKALIGKTWVDRDILRLVDDEQPKVKKPNPFGNTFVTYIESKSSSIEVAKWIQQNQPTATELFTYLVSIKALK